MFASLITLWAACATTTLVAGAPTNALDKTALLQNGLDAQALNAEFTTISAKDPCNSGQMACIDGAPALCQFGSWQVQGCSDSRECFALPLVKDRGTSLGCTSYANALSLISATGAKGGITPENGANTTIPLPTMTPIVSPSAPNSLSPPTNTSVPAVPAASPTISVTSASSNASSSQPSDAVPVITVTQTVVVQVTPTITLPPVTTTLTPSDAAKILSSLSANGAFPQTISSSASSVTASGTPSPTPASSQASTVSAAGLRNGSVEPSGSIPSAAAAAGNPPYGRAVLSARRFVRRA